MKIWGFKGRILYKLGNVVLLLLAIHFVVVIIGLYTSRRLSGDATEINYAGTVRMRSFKIGFLLNRMKNASAGERPALKKDIDHERRVIEEILYGLRDGNLKYGLPGEKDEKILNQLDIIIKRWEDDISPLLKRIIDSSNPEEVQELISKYNDRVVDYVSSVDKTVHLFEEDSETKVVFLNRVEYLLLVPAVIVSSFALFMIFLLVERPIELFVAGMKKVKEGNLDARIEVKSADEFRFMAETFNSMVSELERTHKALEAFATTDSLTSLLNPKGFDERLNYELKRITRHQEPISLIMSDIDDFKKINDTYGHQAGDLVLKKVAKILTSTAREIDIVARYGGDEFMVLLLNTDEKRAIKMAERIRKAVDTMEFKPEGNKISVTLSLGIATTLMDPKIKKEEFIGFADKALYHAKRMGKNRAWHYSGIQI